MITYLTVKQFGPHAEATYNFTSGLNLITGPNFSGKTRLLMAIMYALWGSSAINVKATSLKNRTQDKPHSVDLGFIIGETEYQVRRTSSTCVLKRDGENIANGSAPVNSEIERIFGLGRSLFTSLKFSAQGEASQLLTLGATQLHNMVEKIVGVDVINRVMARAKLAKDEAVTIVGEIPEENVEQWASYLQQSQQFLGVKQAQWAQERETLQFVAQQHAEVQAALKAGREQLRLFSEHRLEMENLRATLSTLREQQERTAKTIPDTPPDVEHAGKYYESLTQIQATYHRLRQERQNASARQEFLQSQQTKRESEFLSATRVLENLPKKEQGIHDHVKEQREVYAGSVRLTEANSGQLRRSLEESSCSQCKRPFEGFDPEDIAKQIDDNDRHLEELKTQLEHMRQQLATFEALDRQIDAAVKRLASAEQAVISGAKEIIDLDTTITRIMSDMDQYVVTPEQILEAKNAYEERTRLMHQFNQGTQEVARLRNECERIESQLLDLEKTVYNVPDNTQVHALEMREKDSAAALAKQTGISSSTEQEIQALQMQLQGVPEQLEAMRLRQERRTYYAARGAGIKQLTEYLKKNRDRFLGTAWDGLLSYTSHFMSQATDNKVTGLGRTDSGEFFFVEDGRQAPIKEASGAQQALMGTGLKLALSSIITSPFSVLLLDEATADMDEDQSMLFTQLVRTYFTSQASQIISVTHRQKDSAVANNVIELAR